MSDDEHSEIRDGDEIKETDIVFDCPSCGKSLARSWTTLASGGPPTRKPARRSGVNSSNTQRPMARKRSENAKENAAQDPTGPTPVFCKKAEKKSLI